MLDRFSPLEREARAAHADALARDAFPVGDTCQAFLEGYVRGKFADYPVRYVSGLREDDRDRRAEGKR